MNEPARGVESRTCGTMTEPTTPPPPAAWSDLGRPNQPALWGMAYFALGEGSTESGDAYLRHYYAFTGAFAEKIAAGNLTSPGAIADFVRGYEDAGCDELVLFPTSASIDQLERLADVIH